jgi:hypothetical protein
MIFPINKYKLTKCKNQRRDGISLYNIDYHIYLTTINMVLKVVKEHTKPFTVHSRHNMERVGNMMN